jgi:endonuclease-3
MRVLPQKEWIDFSHRMINHGRRICVARNPKCDICPLNKICPKVGVIDRKKKVVQQAKPARSAKS